MMWRHTIERGLEWAKYGSSVVHSCNQFKRLDLKTKKGNVLAQLFYQTNLPYQKLQMCCCISIESLVSIQIQYKEQMNKPRYKPLLLLNCHHNTYDVANW